MDVASRPTVAASLPLPPPELQSHVLNREAKPEDFLAAGRRGADSLEQALAAHDMTTGQFQRILDFGCGSARVLRHFAPLFAGRDVHGADVNADVIEWDRAHIPGVTFHHHAEDPPLPFANDYFDYLWSIAIFSHLPEEKAIRWQSHLQQILRPGGIALIAVHGLFRFNEDVARGCIRPEAAREFDARGFTYVQACEDRHLPQWYSNAFMSEDYARGLFGRWFDVLDYLERGMMDRQDLLVLRRR
jgi:SAM-dependent methyltransferase